jgi:hypothetical protein
MSEDGKSVVAVYARGPSLLGSVKSVDEKAGTLTVEVKRKDSGTEMTLTIARGARITLDDGLGKKGDAPKEGKLSDLTIEGVAVHVQLTVNRQSALSISVQGRTLFGQVKSFDSGTNVLTMTLKEDGGLVDKEFTLAKGARVDGTLTAGASASVRLAVREKAVAVHVHVHEAK